MTKTQTNKEPNQKIEKKNKTKKEDRDWRPLVVASSMVAAELVSFCQTFSWHLAHKPKHKQRPKPRNRDLNPKTKTQTCLALDQSCWHGTIAMVVMWSSKIPSQMSPWHWFEKRVEDGNRKTWVSVMKGVFSHHGCGWERGSRHGWKRKKKKKGARGLRERKEKGLSLR